MSVHDRLTPEESATLAAWRRALVRWAVVTMLMAAALFFIGFGVTLPPHIEFALAGLLAVAVMGLLRIARAGRCPRCGGRLPLEPRFVVPLRCPTCGVSLHAESEPEAPPAD